MTMDNIARIIDVGVNQAIRIKNLQAENKRLRAGLLDYIRVYVEDGAPNKCHWAVKLLGYETAGQALKGE